MESFLSRVWAHLGTLLMGVLAVLSDTHTAITVSPDITITINAVAGLLVALHLVSEKTLEGVLNAVEGVLRVKKITKAPAKVDPTTAAASAAMGQAVAHLQSLTGSTPPVS